MMMMVSYATLILGTTIYFIFGFFFLIIQRQNFENNNGEAVLTSNECFKISLLESRYLELSYYWVRFSILTIGIFWCGLGK
jgi:hypothetical protein